MVEKQQYLTKFKQIYERKHGIVISDDIALEYFENLVCLVGAVTQHINLNKIILPKNNERGKL
jgi:regulatory protein YycH of two-component signal transduction system YycFG